jgi:hypothetical protein
MRVEQTLPVENHQLENRLKLFFGGRGPPPGGDIRVPMAAAL